MYVGSFWDEEYANPHNADLFDAEAQDLISDLKCNQFSTSDFNSTPTAKKYSKQKYSLSNFWTLYFFSTSTPPRHTKD